MKTIAAVLLLSVVLASACSGGGDGTTAPPAETVPVVRAITLSPLVASVVVGATQQFTPAFDADANASRAVTWTSSNTSVATVSSTGLVTTLAPGSTTIRATSTLVSSVSGQATLNVTAPVTATLTLTPSSLTLVPGQPQIISVVARDASGTTISNPAVNWSSANNAIASVTSDGRVTGVGVGSTRITATSGPALTTVTVNVIDGAYVTAAGGTFTALDGSVQLEFPAGAVSTPTPVIVHSLSTTTSDPRVLAGTVINIEPAGAFAVTPQLRLRYPPLLAPGVVETQLRLARLVGTSWQDSPVQPVDRAARLVSAPLTSGGTWAILAPPPSLRGFAQTRTMDIGTAVDASALRNDAEYRRVLAAEYNSVTPENAMKFGPIHPAPTTYSFADADTIVGLAVANGMKVHGHVLLWHNQQPAWLTAGTPTRASLLAALKGHIETVVGRYAGRVTSWDVANEMIADDANGLRESFWTTIVGPDVIDSAFAWAKRRDPNAKLYLNDFSVEGINAKSTALLALANRLKAAGIPIDGVGFQAHFLVTAPSAAAITSNINRFVAAGFDVRFTELDVRLADGTDGLATQASIYGSVVDVCRAQPRCTAVTSWGFTDRYSWIPGTFPGFGRGLPFDANYAPKPAYTSLRDALAR